MEGEAGERTLAYKLMRNQNSSTSAAAVRMHSNLATAQKNEQCHYSVDSRGIGSTKIGTGETHADVEKVDWDPPCKRRMHQE